MMKTYVLLVGLLLSLMNSSAFAENTNEGIPDRYFRDLVIFNHFDQEKANQKTIGMEMEFFGLSMDETVKRVIDTLGGEDAGKIETLAGGGRLIKGTRIGDVKITQENLRSTYDRAIQTGNGRPGLLNNPLVAAAVDGFDSVTAALEIVTEPLNYEQVKEFAKAMDTVSLGAKGTDLIRQVSLQSNIGMDPQNIGKAKRLAANYYRNNGAIRSEVRPNITRAPYLADIKPSFFQQLDDPNWDPSPKEMFEAYIAGSPVKLSRLNLFNLLRSHPDNVDVYHEAKGEKPKVPRPVAEFREANTVVSTTANPTAASTHIMKEVDFAISMVDAAEESGTMTLASEIELAQKNLANPLGPKQSRAPPESGTMRESLDRAFYKPVEVVPVHNGEVLMGNRDVLAGWDITGTDEEVTRQILEKFGREVDNTTNRSGTINEESTAFSTEHFDGFGGRGDGRAINVAEKNGKVMNGKGAGLTPYVLQPYSVTLGWHIGGVDGLASLREGLRTLILGDILSQNGIPSERVAALIDNKKQASTVDGDAQSASIILRELPGGGVRNSHLRAWSKNPAQMRRGLDYMKNLATESGGRKMTDAVYMMRDAQQTAKIAARMQDLYIVHGALTSGNVLVFPAMVDLNYVEFMSHPDPGYTSLGTHSTFGGQADRMKFMLAERQKKYAVANPGIAKMDLDPVFDQAFKLEMQKLTLGRLGLPLELAEKMIAQNPEEVSRYVDAIWNTQMNHLQTDFRKLQQEVVETFPGVGKTIDGEEVSRGIRDRSAAVDRKVLTQDFGFFQRLRVGDANKGYRELPLEQTREIVAMGHRLLEQALKLRLADCGSCNENGQLSRWRRQAKALATKKLPSKDQVETAINGVIAAKEAGKPLTAQLKQVQSLINGPGSFTLLPRATPLTHEEAIPDIAARVSARGHDARVSGELTDITQIQKDMEILSGERELPGKETKLSNRWSEGNKELAREYMIERLKSMGYKIELETTPEGGVNVIATLKGKEKANEIVEVVAHYDSRAPHVPGSDDNASGLGLALDVAEKQAKLRPTRTIRIVLPDLEEEGLLGSEFHVKKVKERGEKVVAAIVLDTLGHHPKLKDGKPARIDIISNKSPSNRKLANAVMFQDQRYTDRKVRLSPTIWGNGEGNSDHGSYWEEGIPAIFLRQPVEHYNEQTHRSGDNMSQINLEYLKEVGKLVNEAVSTMAETSLGYRKTAADFGVDDSNFDSLRREGLIPNADHYAASKPVRSTIFRVLNTDVGYLFRRARSALASRFPRIFGAPGEEDVESIFKRELAAAKEAGLQGDDKTVAEFLRKWNIEPTTEVSRMPAGSCHDDYSKVAGD